MFIWTKFFPSVDLLAIIGFFGHLQSTFGFDSEYLSYIVLSSISYALFANIAASRNSASFSLIVSSGKSSSYASNFSWASYLAFTFSSYYLFKFGSNYVCKYNGVVYFICFIIAFSFLSQSIWYTLSPSISSFGSFILLIWQTFLTSSALSLSSLFYSFNFLWSYLALA